MNPKTSGIRKAAILVAALDRSAADRVLDRMDPADAQRVRQMTVELDQIDPEEQRQIIDEFFRVRPMVSEKHPPGIELDGRLARLLSVRPSPSSPEEAPETGPGGGRPFCFLHDAEGEKLAGLLASERPQTIALVLSHLPPKQSSNVLARLSPALQVEVVCRLAHLEETDPEILREVERALQSRFSEQVLLQRRRVAGLSAVAGILKASDRDVGMQILGNLASHDRSLADRLTPDRLEFAELAQLRDSALAAIFRAAETELVVLALLGAPPELIERVLGGFPESEAELLRDRLDHPGPIRLSDVEEARRRIAALAERLVIEGRIQLPHRRSSTEEKARTP